MLCDEIILSNKLKIQSMILTDEEQKESDLEGKKKKYFHEKHATYWKELEDKKIKKGHVTNI